MHISSCLRFVLAGSFLAIAAGTTPLVLSRPAEACVLCLPYPQKTSVDYILDSDTIVFAREDSSRHLAYAPVETLKGSAEGVVIPLLIDARTERRLQRDAGLRAVLAEDRRGGTWTFLGLAGAEYQAILREAVGWDAQSPTERAKFFAPYLRSDDRALADLAFLEVARAPYGVIRDLKTDVTRDDLYRVINDWFRIDWHNLYILMLGMSDREDDIGFVRAKLFATARFEQTVNLAAYATAYIEMRGVDAVNWLAGEYLSGLPHSDAELIEVLKALSTQGNSGRDDLRPAILDAYDRLLTHRPALAGYVANDLSGWRIARFVPQMNEILKAETGLDEASRLAVAAYLAVAIQPAAGAALNQ
jgi:hypothetical protein